MISELKTCSEETFSSWKKKKRTHILAWAYDSVGSMIAYHIGKPGLEPSTTGNGHSGAHLWFLHLGGKGRKRRRSRSSWATQERKMTYSHNSVECNGGSRVWLFQGPNKTLIPQIFVPLAHDIAVLSPNSSWESFLTQELKEALSHTELGMGRHRRPTFCDCLSFLPSEQIL